MLMAAGLETEAHRNIGMQEDDTLTPSVKSQTDTLSGSTNGLERSESGHRSSSSGHFTSRSPVLSPQSECQTLPADSLVLDQDSWDSRMSETETETPSSGQSNALIQGSSQKHLGVLQAKMGSGARRETSPEHHTAALNSTERRRDDDVFLLIYCM